MSTLSIPIHPIKRPTQTPINPFNIEPLVKAETITSPIIPIRAMSAFEDFRAIADITGINVTAMIQLDKPPTKEPYVAYPSARPASPFSAIGNPSRAVQADAGVPGVRKSIAAKDPPNFVPTYTPIITKRAGNGFKEYVTGNKIIIAIGELNPGKAPTSSPKNVPKNSKVKLNGSKQA
mgnify:FL=1